MSDEFLDPVKKALANRVGHRCSNPECRAATSGPQDDPARSVNVGVAAHITAASPGGARYDPDLLPQERSSPSNGIWLCQTDAKLVDNDSARFTVDVLRKWKFDAEAEARDRVGRTSVSVIPPSTLIGIGSTIRIASVVPREEEQSDFVVLDESDDTLVVEKIGAQRRIEIPKSLIEKFHRFTPPKPSRVQLSGRLQWISRARIFEVCSEKPETPYGIPKAIDDRYPARYSINGSFGREGVAGMAEQAEDYVLFEWACECGAELHVHGVRYLGCRAGQATVACPDCGKEHHLPTRPLRTFVREGDAWQAVSGG